MEVLRGRGRLAAVLCGGSLAILAFLILFPTTPDAIKAPLLTAIAILWMAGALAVTPLERSVRTLLASGAGLLYAIAFVLPAAVVNSGHDFVWGFQAFVFGILVVPVAWIANVTFVLALTARRAGNDRRVLVLSVVGVILALTAPLSLGADFVMSVGFFAWVLAPAVLAVSLARDRPAEPDAGLVSEAAAGP
jgi:hypothetical protein